MANCNVRLPEELRARLDAEAQRQGLARAEVTRLAIAEFLARRERERFLSALVAEARSAYADPKIRREAPPVAADFAAADGEALDLVQGEPDPARRTAARRGRRRR